MNWNIESENKKRISRRIIPATQKTLFNPPAVLMIDPIHPHNVGQVLRACSSFAINQLWMTGNKAAKHLAQSKRIPRELRLKAYENTTIFHSPEFPQLDDSITPIAIETSPDAESLVGFQHPENAFYVFGSEADGIPEKILEQCKSTVIIPSNHCINVSAAVYITLYDRTFKLHGYKGVV